MILRLFLLLIFTNQTLSARTFKRIPQPILENSELKFAPGQVFKLHGSGFIKGYPQAHKIKLRQKKEKYNAKVLNAQSNNLTILSPEDIEYGDYDLELKIKTRFLRSKKSRFMEALKLRPPAPPKPELEYKVIQSAKELEKLKLRSQFQNNELKLKIKELETGPNLIRSYYTVNGWDSLESEANKLYYFPEKEMKTSLEIESQSPLKTLALTKDLKKKFNVSDITQIKENDLSKHFYLSTPDLPKYLEYIIQLSPVFIEKLHVKAAEYAILRNRSSESFLLENCHLYDSIKKRYSFSSDDLIPAKEFIKLEANLGLNDSSPDSMSLECNEETIDSFHYTKLDFEGFAIREDK